MRRLLFSFLLFISSVASVHASTIYAKITGDTVQWTNAIVKGDEIQQSVWQRGDSFNMLPIQRWSPAFYKNPQTSLKFSSQLGASFSAKFEDTGIEFRTANAFEIINGGFGTGAKCSKVDRAGGDFLLKSSSSCGVDFTIDQNRKLRPFDFYRTSFKLPDLLAKFNQENVPAGRYIASFSQPVAYFLIYENQQVESYQIYQDQVQIVIDYQPSFLSSVSVFGDGKFKLEYDTDKHNVKGETKYYVNVHGYINPGIKMSFLSSGKKDVFSLENLETGTQIPYNLICEKCDDKLVIDKGNMDDDYANIGFVGSNLNFVLDFNFDDINAEDVDEGDYSDAVTIMFELDL